MMMMMMMTVMLLIPMMMMMMLDLVGGFEAGIGDFRDGQLFVISLFCRDHRSVSGQWKVDARVRHLRGGKDAKKKKKLGTNVLGLSI